MEYIKDKVNLNTKMIGRLAKQRRFLFQMIQWTIGSGMTQAAWDYLTLHKYGPVSFILHSVFLLSKHNYNALQLKIATLKILCKFLFALILSFPLCRR